jgi:hypothetical protein
LAKKIIQLPGKARLRKREWRKLLIGLLALCWFFGRVWFAFIGKDFLSDLINPCDTFCGKQELDSTQEADDTLDGKREQGDNMHDVCNISSVCVRLRPDRGSHQRQPHCLQLPMD